MIVLVCGGRNFNDRRLLSKVLDSFKISVVVNGGARGADKLSTWWAKQRSVECREYRADWDKHGKAAGIIRNGQMLKDEEINMVIAFPGGTGTEDMIRRSRKAGKTVLIIGEENSK